MVTTDLNSLNERELTKEFEKTWKFMKDLGKKYGISTDEPIQPIPPFPPLADGEIPFIEISSS